MTKTEQAIRDQLRNTFAAAALQGILAGGYQGEYSYAARHAYEYADAMLAKWEESHA